MKRYLPLINFVLFMMLLAVSFGIHQQERHIIELQMQTIDAQQHDLEHWKALAMSCEGIVLGSTH